MPIEQVQQFSIICMQNLKSPSKSSPPQSLWALINKHSDIATYFKSSTQQAHFEQLAVELLRQAINHRKANQKHYNVAYVKHNRFLSPSQKQNVAPKITEVIPLTQQAIKIYGKPKVKLDDQYFTVIEEAQNFYSNKNIQGEQRTQSQRNLDKHLPQRDINSQKAKTTNQIDNAEVQDAKQNDLQIEESRYLSPSSAHQIVYPKQSKKELAATKEEHLKRKIQHQHKRKPESEKEEKKPEKIDLKIESNFKTTMKGKAPKMLEVNSPKNVGRIQKYDDVQSRIKFLIDRDKKNKKLENKLEQQNKKIEKLQERQERLLLRQYEQSKELQKQVVRPKTQDLLCCCSSDEEIQSKLIEMKQIQNYKSHKVLSNLQSKISPIKSYKISSNPVYPMTSSESSLSSNQEIVITGAH